MKRTIVLAVATLIPLAISCSWTSPGSLKTRGGETSVPVHTASFGSIPFLPEFRPSAVSQSRFIMREYGQTIKDCARHYDIDWRFVLAIINQESKFDTSAESPKGAVGLMQIMPATFNDVTDSTAKTDIADPRQNIAAGIKHLSILMDAFENLSFEDRMKCTLAAYNAGLGRISDAQQLAGFLSNDSNSWEGVRGALPLLSKRFSTLHQRVWDVDHPRNGYFNNYRETIEYVDHVMDYYSQYRQMYN